MLPVRSSCCGLCPPESPSEALLGPNIKSSRGCSPLTWMFQSVHGCFRASMAHALAPITDDRIPLSTDATHALEMFLCSLWSKKAQRRRTAIIYLFHETSAMFGAHGVWHQWLVPRAETEKRRGAGAALISQRKEKIPHSTDAPLTSSPLWTQHPPRCSSPARAPRSGTSTASSKAKARVLPPVTRVSAAHRVPPRSRPKALRSVRTEPRRPHRLTARPLLLCDRGRRGRMEGEGGRARTC